MPAGHLLHPAKVAALEPLDAAGRPPTLELETVLTKRVAQVHVGDVTLVERAVVDVRVLLVGRARVIRRAHEAGGRCGKAGAAEQGFLPSVKLSRFGWDLPAAEVEEAIVLGMLPVAAVDARVHEHLRVQRLLLAALRRPQRQRSDKVASGGEAEGGHRAWAALAHARDGGLEVVERIVEIVVRQQPILEHHRSDVVLSEPLDHW